MAEEMTPDELGERIVQGEGLRTDFKSGKTPDRTELAKDIVCFANTDGGQLIFGVSEDGVVGGVEDVGALLDRVEEVAFSRCRPPVTVVPEVLAVELPRLRPRTIHIGTGLRLDRAIPFRAAIPVDLIVNRRRVSAEHLADVPRFTTPAQLTENDLPLLEPQRFPPAHPPYPSLDNSGIISLGCRFDHLSPALPAASQPEPAGPPPVQINFQPPRNRLGPRNRLSVVGGSRPDV
jgi:Schlafen, AlbA_2